MNLYGCRLQAVIDAIGSNDSKILESSANQLSQLLNHESDQQRAAAWLRTIVQDGYPLRWQRGPPAILDDGGLLVSHLETEIHVFAVHSLLKAVAEDSLLDLAMQSSNWHHSAVVALQEELSSCGFTRSEECPPEFFDFMSALSRGTPLFGDDFRTDWSFYSFLLNNQLSELLRALAAGLRYEKELPDYFPEDRRKKMQTRLCEEGRAFVDELSRWLQRIEEAGQDAYVIWW